jgi:hypothetical protein
MSAIYLTASELVNRGNNIECCDCCSEADDAPENSIWTIWNNKRIYCPKCAAHENIGPRS